MATLFAKTTGTQQVASSQFVNMEGLKLELPAKTSGLRSALIILNVPMPYAKGNDYPGINFQITYNGEAVGNGGFTYSQQQPQAFGRQPFTLVAQVELKDTTTSIIQAQWSNVRGSTGIIDSYACISAILN
ncbi:MAG: hypothetical protein AB1489_31455 [Acidobacteriota bacterium]